MQTVLAQNVDEVNSHQYTNALINSTSPYLLQHAHNPVNWMPWGEEAFAKAKREGKPIFVSIGYSTCYWCHVMERESFENEQVAEVLNEHYVAIKVDREERPDIDEQLMLATQLLTGRGGWPNSVWLTEDGRPWMAGTYFPKDNFIDALQQLARVWTTQRDNVEKQAQSLTSAVREATQVPTPTAASGESSAFEKILVGLKQQFDAEHGGFGPAPKFPPHGALRLLIHAVEDGKEKAVEMLTTTLDAMWCGGIHDHVGGGFHRYSTDRIWLLPHFEKMLYDNAQLMRIYTEAYRVTGHDRYRLAVQDIFSWLEREMTDQQGGFYSAVDSESPGGEEGKFYTWSVQELQDVLGSENAEWLTAIYQATAEGNFTEEATGHRPGTNILHLASPQTDKTERARSQQLLDTLLTAREMRQRPHLDDKILTAWNGLMISALARAGVVFDDDRYTQAAVRAAKFVLAEMQPAGRPLLRSWRKGVAALPAYLNDYAFFAEGLVELHQATGEVTWLDQCEELVQQMQKLFEDTEQGGFFFTSEDHEALLTRSKNLFGGGNLPVGNGVAAQVLLRLHEATGKDIYLDSFQKSLSAFEELMRRSPRQVEHLVLAKIQFESGKQQIAKNLRETEQQGRQKQLDQPIRSGDDILQVVVKHAKLKIKPGEQAQLTVAIDIKSEFRIYRPSKTEIPVQALAIELKDLPQIAISHIDFPPGKVKRDTVFDAELTTYEKSVELTVHFQAAKELDSAQTAGVLRVSYQACDDRRCLLPARFEIPVSFDITAGEEPGDSESK